MRPLLLLVALTACGSSPSPRPDASDAEPVSATAAEAPAQVTHASIDLDDPAQCAGCHGAVVEEWKTSMHAHAHHDNDPIYAGMRSLRMAKQGEQIAGKCAQCHNPRSPGDPDSPAGKAGVSCATCHHLAAVDTSGDKKGAKALTFASEPVLRGPHDISEGAAAPHGVGPAAPWLTDGQTVCLACHGVMKNPQGAPTCTTGSEHAEAATGQSCTDCHMPEVQGSSGAVSTRPTHRSHAFLGGHTLYGEGASTDFMASAVDATLVRDGSRLDLTLTSTSGHSVPSGFPGRMVLVKAVGLDTDGKVVWSNSSDDPMAQDPQAVLNTGYVDADGKPVLPPFAAKKARDTRLVHGQPRTLSWTLPDGVATAKATLLYRLVPPPAVGPLGLEGSPLAEPRPFRTVEGSAP